MSDDPRIRASNAEQLLGNELLVDTLAKMERDAVDDLASASLGDDAALRALTARLQAVRAFAGELRSIVTTGRASRREPPAVA